MTWHESTPYTHIYDVYFGEIRPRFLVEVDAVLASPASFQPYVRSDLRLRARAAAATRVGQLASVRYMSLTTRRRDGSLVSTPVWVVSDDGVRLLVWTSPRSWKARRISRNPHVFVAAADFRGRERGPRLAGTARLLEPEARTLVVPLLRKKYGWQRRLLELRARAKRTIDRSVYIEIADMQPERGNDE